MNTEDIKKNESALLCRTYGRYPLAVSWAQGTRLYTPEGRVYTDLLAGIAVCNLEHSFIFFSRLFLVFTLQMPSSAFGPWEE